MKWQIEELKYEVNDSVNKNGAYLKSGDVASIKFEPDCIPLEFFLNGISILNYTDFLVSFNNQSVFYSPPGSLKFYKNLDWEDLEDLKDIGFVSRNDIVVYHENAGEAIIRKSITTEIVLDYSKFIYNKLNALYPDFCGIWKNRFEAEIKSLEENI